MSKKQEEALRNSRNQMINNVIALLQSELDERETEDDYSSSAKIALAALETYSVKMNKDFDKKYCKKLVKMFVPRMYTIYSYFSGEACTSYAAAVRALKEMQLEHKDDFKYGRIIKMYVEGDEEEEKDDANEYSKD